VSTLNACPSLKVDSTLPVRSLSSKTGFLVDHLEPCDGDCAGAEAMKIKTYERLELD
jgi:hypothetical protein